MAEGEGRHLDKRWALAQRPVGDADAIARGGVMDGWRFHAEIMRLAWRDCYVASLLPPAHFVQAHGVFEALEERLAAVGVDVALAGEQVAERLGDEDLAGARFRGNARGEDDGGAEEVAVFLDRFARV